MGKQSTQRGDSTAGAGLPGAAPPPPALAARGIAGRAILWTVLALAAGAALLMGYLQVTQAQEPPMTQVFAPGLVLTPDPVVPGDEGGSELSFTITYTPTTTYPHTVTGMSVTQSGQLRVNISSAIGTGTTTT